MKKYTPCTYSHLFSSSVRGRVTPLFKINNSICSLQDIRKVFQILSNFLWAVSLQAKNTDLSTLTQKQIANHQKSSLWFHNFLKLRWKLNSLKNSMSAYPHTSAVQFQPVTTMLFSIRTLNLKFKSPWTSTSRFTKASEITPSITGLSVAVKPFSVCYPAKAHQCCLLDPLGPLLPSPHGQ